MNGRYERRFTNPAQRYLSNGAMDRFDRVVREGITELVTRLDEQDLVAEAERLTKAEADRRERMRRAQGVERSGDPGE
jgi:hypothetical protein